MAKADKDGQEASQKAPKSRTGILETSPELRNTVAAIEKQFGEGSIMPLGGDQSAADRRHLDRQPVARYRPGRPGASRAAASSRSSAPNRAARRRSPCMWWPRPKRPAASPRSSTPNTPSTPAGPRSSASIWKCCSSASPASGEEAMHITEMLDQIERGRRDRHRLGGRPGAQEGTRRRNRRFARRPAGPAHEPVDAQAHRRDRQEPHRR